MNKIYAILISLLVIVGVTGFKHVPQNADVYLFVGASNMSGKGQMPARQSVSQDIFTVTDNFEIIQGKEPSDKSHNLQSVSRDAGAIYSPVMQTALTILSGNSAHSVIFVNCAKSSSGLSDWQRDLSVGTLYGECLARGQYFSSENGIKGIFIIEGEMEAQGNSGIEPAENWANNFVRLISDLRTDIGYDVPVVFVKVHKDMPGQYVYIVQKQQSLAENMLPLMSMVNTDDLHLPFGSWHYRTQEIMTIGQRMGLAFLELVSP